MSYECVALSEPDINGIQNCVSWAVSTSHSFADQLNALSPADATQLLTQTAAIFACAWGWNFLGNFANR